MSDEQTATPPIALVYEQLRIPVVSGRRGSLTVRNLIYVLAGLGFVAAGFLISPFWFLVSAPFLAFGVYPTKSFSLDEIVLSYLTFPKGKGKRRGEEETTGGDMVVHVSGEGAVAVDVVRVLRDETGKPLLPDGTPIEIVVDGRRVEETVVRNGVVSAVLVVMQDRSEVKLVDASTGRVVDSFKIFLRREKGEEA